LREQRKSYYSIRIRKITKWLLVLLLAATPVQAQNWMPFSIPCGPVEPLFRLLADKEEMLLFTSLGTMFGTNGVAYTGAGMLFTNQETGGWSFVVRFTEELACLVGSGTDFAPYDGWSPGEKDEL